MNSVIKFSGLIFREVGFLVAVSIAQGNAAGLELFVGRPDAIYRQGEEVKFEVRASQQEGKVCWSLSKDGIPLRNGVTPLKDGRATVAGSLDEPGFLLCDVELEGGAGKCRGAVAVDPVLIAPSLPPPEDFDAFWNGNLSALADIPPNADYTPVASPRDSVVVQDVRADSLGGPVTGYLAKPAGAKGGSLPAILILQGAGVRGSSLGSAVEWAERGFLAMDINAHGIPNGKPAAYYTELGNGALKNYQSHGRNSQETSYFKPMFLRVVRALDVLCAQPEWNGKVLVTYGPSQGAAQALAAAALDSRVTFYVAALPALCDPTGSAANRISGWPYGQPGLKLEPNVLNAVRYFDMTNFAHRIKSPGFFTVGFVDQSCHPTGVYATFNAVRSPKEIFNDISSPHHVSDEAKRRMIEAVMQHAQSFSQSNET